MTTVQRMLKRVSVGICFALPAICVGLASEYGNMLAPKSAQAGVAGESRKKEDAVLRPLVREDTSTLRRAVDRANAAGAGQSPVAFANETQRVVVQPDVPGGIPEPEVPVAVPEFRLSSIMLGGGTPIAMIDGKVRRAGDEVAAGWTVRAIDHSDGTVSLIGPKGKQIELKLRGKER